MGKAMMVILLGMASLFALGACVGPATASAAPQAAAQQGLAAPAAAGKQYDSVQGLTFSPDGKRFAYIASVGKKQLAVIDGKESSQYDSVIGLKFSPDSSRVAFVAGMSKKQLVVVDGVEGSQYDSVLRLTFSPDGKSVAYIAVLGKKQQVITN
jgi:roadblock/LC7 domain-containing protein